MNPSDAGDPGYAQETKLPWRDWLLLPALSLATICLLVVSTDLIERRMFPSFDGSGEDCIVFNDPSTGARGIPNSVCREKIPEGEVAEYRFNSCGHRTDEQCGTKPPGTYRIVMIGTSYAMGMRVANEKTVAALLPLELSQTTGRNVEIYNEGMPWRPPHVIALHFNEVLAAKPVMILWILNPSDVWNPMISPHPPEAPQARRASWVPSPFHKAWQFVRAEALLHSVFLIRHFMYESQSLLVTSYLAEKPGVLLEQKYHSPEFMRTEPSAEWQDHLRDLDSDAANIEAQARVAGVPVVAVLLPERAPAAILSMDTWPAGFDPYKLDNELRTMIESHGGIYVDILPDFRNTPNAEQVFFPIEGHPNVAGHALIAKFLARKLTSGVVPALKADSQQGVAAEQSR